MTEAAEYVREWRQARGLTRATAADILKLDPHHLYMVESGRRKASPILLELIRILKENERLQSYLKP